MAAFQLLGGGALRTPFPVLLELEGGGAGVLVVLIRWPFPSPSFPLEFDCGMGGIFGYNCCPYIDPLAPPPVDGPTSPYDVLELLQFGANPLPPPPMPPPYSLLELLIFTLYIDRELGKMADPADDQLLGCI